MDTSGELEFSEFERAAFDDPSDFKKFIMELGEEYCLTDVDDLVFYFEKRITDFKMFIKILNQFKNEKGI